MIHKGSYKVILFERKALVIGGSSVEKTSYKRLYLSKVLKKIKESMR